jgi:hypothetical protein
LTRGDRLVEPLRAVFPRSAVSKGLKPPGGRDFDATPKVGAVECDLTLIGWRADVWQSSCDVGDVVALEPAAEVV